MTDEQLVAEMQRALADQTKPLVERQDAVETKLRRYMEAKALPGGMLPVSTGEPALGSLVARSNEVKNFVGGTYRGAAKVTVANRLWTQKAIITTNPASGLLPGVQVGPVVPLPQAPLALASLIPSFPMREGSLQFVRVKSPRAVAGIQVNEGDAKLEATMVFETITLVPETLACWITVSRQAIQDIAGLELTIDSELLFAIQVLEETEILLGTGPQGHLTGILPIATPVTTTATSAIDAVAALLGSLTSAGIQPSGIVMNPTDFLGIVTTKAETSGVYLTGSPTAGPANTLWGTPLALSLAMPAGQVLAGDFQRAAQLGYREDATVAISSEHADYFVKNLYAVRAEERLALAIKQPAAFAKTTLPAVTGTQVSPAREPNERKR